MPAVIALFNKIIIFDNLLDSVPRRFTDFLSLLITLETVAIDTPALSAMSYIFTSISPCFTKSYIIMFYSYKKARKYIFIMVILVKKC